MSKDFQKTTDCTTTGSWGISRHNVSGVGKKVKQPIPIWPGTLVWLLVGAIYLDKGYKTTKKFILDKLIKPHFDFHTLVNTTTNFKSKLIEWAQGQNKVARFDIIHQKHSGNTTEFTAEVLLDDKPVATGTGYSKKKAEQSAAEKALAVLKVE